jgi:urease accessory protein UreF
LLQLLSLDESDTAEFEEYVQNARLGMAYHMESANLAQYIEAAKAKVGNNEAKIIKQAWEELVDKVGGDWEALYELDEATPERGASSETKRQLKTIGGARTNFVLEVFLRTANASSAAVRSSS